MINYIGNISKEDAAVLKTLAEISENILEFGVGASTQILRFYSKGVLTSLDTNPNWIKRTVDNLKKLEITQEVIFKNYHDHSPDNYDLIFVDCVDGLRLEFALKNWRYLTVGGFMAFHDTRRLKDVQNVCRVIEMFFPEIDSVEINKNNSNISIIKKRAPLYLEDWNISEGRNWVQAGFDIPK